MLGSYCLMLAIAASIMLALLPTLGVIFQDIRLMLTAKPLAYLSFALVAIAFIHLGILFVSNDFSYQYVAQHSNTRLPVIYQITAIWGGHEGSILLWLLTLTGWSAAVALCSRHLPTALIARVLAILGMINTGFLLFLVVTSSPFTRNLPYFPIDGQDLNPLLQDIGLIIHPPALYMGYVGFVVPFAFVMAALWFGRLDSAWIRWVRPWALCAWLWLSLGIALGSWWAYYELGWGGWWFWDPVENASLMPWIMGTALLHSLAASEKRGVFQIWTVLLAITTFSLSVLGTFLVRSGVLTSVHAFASDPARGAFILALLALISGGSLLLLMLRAHRLKSTSAFGVLSRESILLVNNLLLATACLVVLTGTLFPLVVDVLNLGKLSVGAPYFNMLFNPLCLVLLAFLGVGQLLRWKKDSLIRLRQALLLNLSVSTAIGLLLPWWITGQWITLVALSLSLSLWVVGGIMIDLWLELRHKSHKLRACMQLSASKYGMWLGHLGVVITVIGVTMTSHFSVERDVRLAENQRIEAGPYAFTLQTLQNIAGPNYQATRATITVQKNNQALTTLYPEKRQYLASGMPMTEVALYPGFINDLYVALGEPVDDQSWAIRVYYKPFVRWIWLGALVMALGGLCAMCDRRYRSRQVAPLPSHTMA